MTNSLCAIGPRRASPPKWVTYVVFFEEMMFLPLQKPRNDRNEVTWPTARPSARGGFQIENGRAFLGSVAVACIDVLPVTKERIGNNQLGLIYRETLHHGRHRGWREGACSSMKRPGRRK